MAERRDCIRRLSVDIRCGQGTHPVSLAIAPWGTVELTTPYDPLPEIVRRWAGNDCRPDLDDLQERLRRLVPQECLAVQERLASALELENGPQLCGRLAETAEMVLRGGRQSREISSEQLKAGLIADDVALRWAAAIMAGVRHDPSVLAALMQRTEDPDSGVQVAAVWALTEIADVRAVQVLGKWLDGFPPAPLWRKIIDSLERLADPSAIGVLRRTLKRGSWQKGIYAAEALGRLGAVESLLKALDDKRIMRETAAYGVRQIRDLRGVDLILQAGRHKDVARIMAAVLGRVRVKPLIRALVAIRDGSIVERLVDAAKDEDRAVRYPAAWVLAHIGNPHAVEPALEALKDGDRTEGTKAADVLGRSGDPRAVGALLDALKDSDPHVRSSAARSLARIPDLRAGEALIAVMKDSHARVRREAATALGMIREPRAVGPLLEALADRYSWVRAAAGRALGEIGDPRAVDRLLEKLSDADWGVRAAAAGALGDIRDSRAVQPLLEAVDDLRLVALDALGRIRDPRAIGPLFEAFIEREEDERRGAALALARILAVVLLGRPENVSGPM